MATVPNETLPSWVSRASRLPLAFAQVREDAKLELELSEELKDGARIALVASGGCTAAALAAAGRGFRLHLVDVNPAQVALARLKLALLGRGREERLALLGHAPMRPERRLAALGRELGLLGYPLSILGPAPLVGRLGPDQAGRYERFFAALRAVLAEGCSLEECLERVAQPRLLVRLFGEAACRDPREPFASHFSRVLRRAVSCPGAESNPYLAQMLKGRFGAELLPWLKAAPARHPVRAACSAGAMESALRRSARDYDLLQLSNILDWLSAQEVRRLLRVAWAALRPGGLVLIRQLNSSLDIPACGPLFDWNQERSAALLSRERSGLYRRVHLGRKA